MPSPVPHSHVITRNLSMLSAPPLISSDQSPALASLPVSPLIMSSPPELPVHALAVHLSWFPSVEPYENQLLANSINPLVPIFLHPASHREASHRWLKPILHLHPTCSQPNRSSTKQAPSSQGLTLAHDPEAARAGIPAALAFGFVH